MSGYCSQCGQAGGCDCRKPAMTEPLDALVERLESWLVSSAMERSPIDAIFTVTTELKAMQTEIGRLREALEPFSKALGDVAEHDARWADADTIEYDGFPECITVGDLRRARAALANPSPEQGETK